MLGELYKPKGKALEHAEFILNIPESRCQACNVALGCTGGCTYCYGPKSSMRFSEYSIVKRPDYNLVEVVGNQLRRMPEKPLGVFLSFLTDPAMNWVQTHPLCDYLLDQGISVATSTKFAELPPIPGVHTGITYTVSEEDYWKRYEPGTSKPEFRVRYLRDADRMGNPTWASIEPFPVKIIYPASIEKTVDDLNFVDKLILGRWNYDSRASTKEAIEEYRNTIPSFIDSCRTYGIKYYVKQETLALLNTEE